MKNAKFEIFWPHFKLFAPLFFQAGDDSDSSGEESDNLDWLPDPDKIYGKDETTTENEELHKQQE